MVTKSEHKESKTKRIRRKVWKWSKRIFIWIFIVQLFYIILLKWINPPVTMTQFVSWVSGHGFKRDYVSRKNISPNAKLAVIAAEDQLFPDHHGFDWKSINKAMSYNKKKPGRIRGASTISQQVAKNIFLWQGRSWLRKGLEVYFTFMIELIWGKKRILEMYLNQVEMGEGIFGIEMASEKYFNKPAKNLTKQEAAMIAACLPNPKKYTVKPLSAYVSSRSRWIMQQMNNLQTDPDIQRLTGMKPP
ncbi:MAG TPA: monofunctional biosynthetic peptidoglycan transglycosylase [Chitinophagaceae bacterium]|nr:monofunctional biosynthetic peptidoglycan transglycosylase [Chitinophagaceae bacterium]